MTKHYFWKGRIQEELSYPRFQEARWRSQVDFSLDTPRLPNAEAVAQNPSLSVTLESYVSACGEVKTFQSETVSVVFFHCM